MKAVGLGFLLVGTLAFLFPYYDEFVAGLTLNTDQSRLVGALCIVVGAMAMAFRRRSD